MATFDNDSPLNIGPERGFADRRLPQCETDSTVVGSVLASKLLGPPRRGRQPLFPQQDRLIRRMLAVYPVDSFDQIGKKKSGT
jgi:hypothetical protein